MRMTHIYHSGFAVELPSCSLVFDWCQGELPDLPEDLPLIVFVSHAHADHYGRCIWDLRGRFDDIVYVLDAEVAETAMGWAQVVAMRPHERATAGPVTVGALRSNDEGVAFVVEAPETSIFFSGDMNVWWWDRPRRENEASDAFFRQEIGRVSGPVDVAFLPVDPRLKDPTAGVRAFEDAVGARLVVPMHYWDRGAEAQAAVARDPALAPWRDGIDFSRVIET